VAFGWMFTAMMAGVAGYQAYRLSAPGRAVRAAHLLMSVGMAAMFAPVGWSLSQAVGVAVYAAAAIWCLAARGAGRLHAVTGSLAMAYMFALPGVARGHMGGMVMSPGGAYAWVSLALACYFTAETVWALRPLLATGRKPAVDAACHVATGIAMAFMLLTLS
jgi:Domain of unknown function (DUF5134)